MRLGRAIEAMRLLGYLRLRAPKPPRRGTVPLENRLAQFPVTGLPLAEPVEIRWDRHQIPFIEANADRDLAVALGLVHAHLRLGQMELLRRVAYGRVSEMVGPLAFDLDHTLRILDFGRAVPAIDRALPDTTREWLAGFVAGINARLLRTDLPLPLEFALFDLRREPWSVADVLMLGRLVGADIVWLAWQRLLSAREAPGWRDLWARLVGADAAPAPETDTAEAGPAAAAQQGLLGVNNRSGSNSLAVAATRSAGGGAWIASDPHLGLSLPNNWLIAGYRSPGHHAVGLMIPGLPFVALGRNPWIAWGGTSLHALASELHDISDLADASLQEREETIAVRWSAERRVIVRRCAVGPVLSDSALFGAYRGRLALRWVGHHPSDEFTAMLALNRACDWNAFTAALDGFAVPGQNMIYADAAGHVGHALAARVPQGAAALPDDLVSRGAAPAWEAFLTTRDLPQRYDPPAGFVVSANDRPAGTAPVVGHLFSSRDRVERISAVLEAAGAIGFTRLARLQQDVEVASARQLARLLAQLARTGAVPAPGSRGDRILALLKAWDGCYRVDSHGAAAFEVLLFHFARRFYPPAVQAAYAASWKLRDLIRRDVERGGEPRLADAARCALRDTARRWHWRSWGELHRLRLDHPLAALPLIGRRYRYFDLPAAGGSESVMKTANGLAGGRHRVRYGSNARHVSDLSDLDANHFALLGGQDGWFGSTTFADQVDLWRAGAYVRVPLLPETVRRSFPFVTRLEPAEAGPT